MNLKLKTLGLEPLNQPWTRLAEVWYFIPMAVFWSAYPSIVEVRIVSKELFYGRLQQLYSLMVLLAYVVVLPMTLAAQWLNSLVAYWFPAHGTCFLFRNGTRAILCPKGLAGRGTVG